MQETLRSGLINLLDGGFDSLVLIVSAGSDRGVGLFDLGLQRRVGSLVASGLNSNNADALFRGFNVGHGHTSSAKQSYKSRIEYNTIFSEKNQVLFQNISVFFTDTFLCIRPISPKMQMEGSFLQLRTDLAIETPGIETPQSGVTLFTSSYREARILRIAIDDEKAATQLERPMGNYVTVELPPLSDSEEELEDYATRIGRELSLLLPEEGPILVIGLGNQRITPDALGPEVAARVLATRHIEAEFARAMQLEGLRPTAVASPGVLGQTGVETGEIVRGLCHTVKPAAVIAIDALAAGQVARLGCTVQLCDAGIAPGSGVGNNRKALDQHTLGVPVIAIGVPTVVDARNLAIELTGDFESEDVVAPRGAAMMVTPREIDLIIRRASQLIAMAINFALQPDYSPRELMNAAL